MDFKLYLRGDGCGSRYAGGTVKIYAKGRDGFHATDVELNDHMTLDQLRDILTEVERRCGKNVKVALDAGYNSVGLFVKPSRKKVRRGKLP